VGRGRAKPTHDPQYLKKKQDAFRHPVG
jgi:hypothetical protein